MNERIRAGTFVIHEGKACLRFKTEDLNEEWRYKSVTELGYLKEIHGFVIFQREAVSQQTLLTMKAWFKQDIRIAIPKNRKKLRHVYLKLSDVVGSDRGLNSVFIRYFGVEPSVTSTLDFDEMEDLEITCEKIRKPKRISQQTKQKLMREKNFLGLYRTEKLNQLLVEV